MKRFRIIACAIGVLAMLILGACGKKGEAVSDNVRLNQTSLVLEIGQQSVLELSGNGAVIADGVIWFSSNSAVASVDSGRVTAVQSGSCVVTANYGGKNYICSVEVAAEKVYSLSADSLELAVGDSQMLSLLEDGVPVEKNTAWVSSNPLVASVKGGLVTAKKEGSATVSASWEGKKFICQVTVVAAEYVTIVNQTTDVSFDGPNSDRTLTYRAITVHENQSFALECRTKNQISLNFTSSDEQVAEIDASGMVQAKRAGVAVIGAESAEPGADGQMYRDEVVLIVCSQNEVVRTGSAYQAELLAQTGSVVRLNLYGDNTFAYYAIESGAADPFSACSGVYVKTAGRIQLYYVEDGTMESRELTEQAGRLIAEDLQIGQTATELTFTQCGAVGVYYCRLEVEAMDETFEFDLTINDDGSYIYFRRYSDVLEEGEVNRGTWEIADGLLEMTYSGGTMRFRILYEGCLKSVGNIPTGGMEAQLTFHAV